MSQKIEENESETYLLKTIDSWNKIVKEIIIDNKKEGRDFDFYRGYACALKDIRKVVEKQ